MIAGEREGLLGGTFVREILGGAEDGAGGVIAGVWGEFPPKQTRGRACCHGASVSGRLATGSQLQNINFVKSKL